MDDDLRSAPGTPPIRRESVRTQRALHVTFLITVWIKGIVGLLQIGGGALLAFVDATRLTALVVSLTAPELREDPNDVIALFLRHSAEQFGHGTRTFASVYLVIHGVIKLLLVIGLLRRKLWSYPASIWVLAGFILYQGYRYFHTHSPWLIALSLLDVAVIFLVWHEYRLVKKHGFSWRKKHT